MTDATSFADVPATTLADLLDRGQVMDIGIRPLWPWMPCGRRASLHRAPPGRTTT